MSLGPRNPTKNFSHLVNCYLEIMFPTFLTLYPPLRGPGGGGGGGLHQDFLEIDFLVVSDRDE